MGRLGSDAELRYSANGSPFLAFNMAMDDAKKTDDAPTEWVRAVVWGEEAERLADSLKQGRRVYCEGRLKLRTWTNAEGIERTSLELSTWTCTPLGAIGRQAPRHQQDAPSERRPRAMPEALAVAGVSQHRRRQLGLDDSDDADLLF